MEWENNFILLLLEKIHVDNPMLGQADASFNMLLFLQGQLQIYPIIEFILYNYMNIKHENL